MTTVRMISTITDWLKTPRLLELMYQSILAGIDMAAIWGVQQNNKTSLAANEGNGAIYAAGELFRMMSETLPDMRALAKSTQTVGASTVVTYAYESADEVVVFVAARDIDVSFGPVTITVDLEGITGGFASVTAERVTTTDPVDEPTSTAVVSTFTPTITVDEGDPAAEITIGQDYEVVRLIFEKPDGTAVDVNRTGSGTGDMLGGGTGNDTLKGHGGADYIYANAGDDTIFGGRMGDQIIGGDGNDSLIGGSGGIFWMAAPVWTR